MNHIRAWVRLRELERRTVRFLGGLSNRDLEYEFAYRQVVGEQASVLDVGGCESLLPLKLARRGYAVTVYDFRAYPESHPNLTSIRGDFLDNRLPDKSFDFVLLISAIEHFGFGSYGAPAYQDGDFRAMAEARRVVKPSGRIVLTFPMASRPHEVAGFERWYDIARVRRLVAGLHILAEEFYVPHTWFLGRVVKWLPASLDQITDVDDVVKRYGCQCVGCYSLSQTPAAHLYHAETSAGVIGSP